MNMNREEQEIKNARERDDASSDTLMRMSEDLITSSKFTEIEKAWKSKD